MLTKHTYILAIAAAALIFILFIAATVDQNNLSPVKISDTPLTLTAAEQQAIAPNTLLAIENALESIWQAIPALKNSLEQNQLSTEKRIKTIEQDIQQLSLAMQQPGDMTEQPVVTEPQMFSPKREQELAEERALARVAAFDHALDGEVRDEGWAGEMESMISFASQGELYQGSTITNPSCKSTFCRFEAIHNGMDSKDDFELIRRELPNSYHMQNFDLGDGTSRTVMYIIRQGEEVNNIIFSTLNPSSG